MSNFDKIKGMSKDEMALFFCRTVVMFLKDKEDYECDICPWEKICEVGGRKGTLKWLEEDADSD